MSSADMIAGYLALFLASGASAGLTGSLLAADILMRHQ